MSEEFKNKGLENTYEPHEAPDELIPVNTNVGNKFGVDVTVEAFGAGLSIIKAFKLSYADKDFSATDAFNFIDPAKRILAVAKKLPLIPNEVTDIITAEEEQKFVDEIIKAGILEGDAKEASVELLAIIIASKNFVTKYLVKK